MIRFLSIRGQSMANTTVNLYRKCKTPEGWRYYPVVMSANGRVKPNAVKVDDAEVAYPVGHYVLRSYDGGNTVWTRVTGGPTEALARSEEHTSELQSLRH